MRGAAGGNTFSVAAAKTERDFYHGWNHGDAFGIAHDFIGNRFVGSAHNFIQDIRRSLNAFVNVGLIFVVGCPAHTSEKQNRGAEREEISYCCTLEFHV